MIRNVAIVSLSSGILGEAFVQFEVEIGLRRLKDFGLNVRFMQHARMGLDYIKAHPEKRAEDLLHAFRDPEIDMILCAIGQTKAPTLPSTAAGSGKEVEAESGGVLCSIKIRIWNKYAGQKNVLYIHARLGTSNWSNTTWEDFRTSSWFLDGCDDASDHSYCDIYAKIDPNSI